MLPRARRTFGELDSAPKYWIYIAFFSLVSCAPGIGDECQTSADCSQGGERLCDVTQRGGYCTVFNCEPGSCPDDSTCIAFAVEESTVASCADASGLSRFSRTFCLASCNSRADCRTGYACVDLSKANPWSAIVVDSGSGKVCIQPLQGTEVPPNRSGEVCSAATTGSTEGGAGSTDVGETNAGAGGAPTSE